MGAYHYHHFFTFFCPFKEGYYLFVSVYQAFLLAKEGFILTFVCWFVHFFSL